MAVLLHPDFAERLHDLSDAEFRQVVSTLCAGTDEERAELDWCEWKRLTGDPYRAERKRGRVLWPAIYERDGHACRRCGATEDLQIDHLLPVSRGGLSVYENLAVLCAPCNLSKRAKTWQEWTGEPWSG